MNSNEARKILGVDENSSPEEIKKAYRSLAMKHHPDRDGGDEKEFKQLQEALSVLETGESHTAQFGGNNSGDPFAFHRAAMEQMMRAQQEQMRTRGVLIDITLEQAYKGGTHQINLQGIPGSPFTIDIPAGVHPDECLKTIDTGGLILKIFAIAKSDGVKIDWGESDPSSRGNMTQELHVSPFKMILGGFQEVVTIEGKTVEVRIPAGLEANTLLKVKDRGYWKNQSCQHRGNLLLRVIPKIQKLEDIPKKELTEFVKAVKAGKSNETVSTS